MNQQIRRICKYILDKVVVAVVIGIMFTIAVAVTMLIEWQ